MSSCKTCKRFKLMDDCGKCMLHGFVLHRSESVLTCDFFEPRLDIVGEILTELERAESIHPNWPADPIHAAAILAEEAGEVVKAVNDAVTKNGSPIDCQTEAIQCAAMCVRFLKNISTYDWKVNY